MRDKTVRETDIPMQVFCLHKQQAVKAKLGSAELIRPERVKGTGKNLLTDTKKQHDPHRCGERDRSGQAVFEAQEYGEDRNSG